MECQVSLDASHCIEVAEGWPGLADEMTRLVISVADSEDTTGCAHCNALLNVPDMKEIVGAAGVRLTARKRVDLRREDLRGRVLRRISNNHAQAPANTTVVGEAARTLAYHEHIVIGNGTAVEYRCPVSGTLGGESVQA